MKVLVSGILGAVLAVFSVFASAHDAVLKMEVIKASPNVNKATRNLVLTCIDLRFHDEIAAYLQDKGLIDNYDQFILAGASFGLSKENLKYPHWWDTFINHYHLANQLHGVDTVYLVDHLDCGMYKAVFPKETKTIKEEREKHIEQLRQVGIRLKENEIATVKLFLLSEDGSKIETISE